MPEQSQQRALETEGSSEQVGQFGGLSAEILPFSPRPRSVLQPLDELALPNFEMQPQTGSQSPLSAQVSFSASNVTRISKSWLFDAFVEIEQLSEAAIAEGLDVPPDKSIETAKIIARLCNNYALSEPSFDVREKGEVEIFCRERSRGLLIVIKPNGLIQVFGDFDRDQWRARYGGAGSTWQRHFKNFVEDISGV